MIKSILKRILNRLRGKRSTELSDFANIGAYTKVDLSGYFEKADSIKIGDYCYIGPEAFWSGLGGITIGNNCMFGPRTVIYTQNHNWRSEVAIPYGPSSEDICRPVTVADNCWICLGAYILPGISVGEGAIVGMGAVVTKDVPPLAIVGGNPAVILGYRDDHTYNRLNENKLWLGELNAR